MASHSAGEPGGTTDGSVTRDEYEAARQKLRSECEELRAEVKQLQEEVRRTRVPVKTETSNPEAVALRVGICKIRSLKAHIQVEQDYQPTGLPTDDAALQELLVGDTERTTHQLRQTAAVVAEQNEEYRQKIDRERQWLDEQREIERSISGKLASATEGRLGRTSKKGVLQLLDKDTQVLVRNNERLLKELKAFVRDYIPEPNEEDIRKWAKQRDGGEAVPLSLFSITEELLRKCMRTPHDPYIRLTPAHRAPYVELLLQSDIAQLHPEDSNRVRLVPFHL